MIVLGLDTCLNRCSVAVLDGQAVLAHAAEEMARGHQERLAPMARQVMAEAGLPFSTLERVGATVGPGSFTGLRVGIAFAKGLGSALGVPAVGVTCVSCEDRGRRSDRTPRAAEPGCVHGRPDLDGRARPRRATRRTS